MTRRVYKFIKAAHALTNLEKGRLKLTTIHELNDPYDLCPVDTSNPFVDHALKAALAPFHEKRRAILCFSRNWDNLLMWSHYGDSHTGMCLGFDIPVESQALNRFPDVLYRPSLLEIQSHSDVTFNLVDQILRSKHEGWSYEQEVRVFVDLSEPPDRGLWWSYFGPSLVLREVIAGAQCDPGKAEEVRSVAGRYGDDVKFLWAGMRPDSFRIEKRTQRPAWHGEISHPGGA